MTQEYRRWSRPSRQAGSGPEAKVAERAWAEPLVGSAESDYTSGCGGAPAVRFSFPCSAARDLVEVRREMVPHFTRAAACLGDADGGVGTDFQLSPHHRNLPG